MSKITERWREIIKILNSFTLRSCCKCLLKCFQCKETENGNDAIMCMKDDTELQPADPSSKKRPWDHIKKEWRISAFVAFH